MTTLQTGDMTSLRTIVVIGMHFFDPLPLMALVEVVHGPRTERSTVDAAVALQGASAKRRWW